MTHSTGHNGFPAGATQELERTEREPFPTKPLELQTYPVSNFQIGYELDSIQAGTYAVHEGLLRLRKSDGYSDDRLTLPTPEMVESLKNDGFVEVSASVPFTGANNSERRTNLEFARTEEAMVFLLAAKEKGVQNLDWEQLTDEQKEAANKLGTNYVDKNGANAPFYTKGLHVPRTEAETVHTDFIDKVGTYAVVDAPTETGGQIATVIVLVDAGGNKTIAGASQNALDMISDLGYTQVEDAPFAIDTIPSTTLEGRRFIMEQGYGWNAEDEGYKMPLRRADGIS